LNKFIINGKKEVSMLGESTWRIYVTFMLKIINHHGVVILD